MSAAADGGLRRARALLWPGLATAAAFLVLVGLGIWQLERLSWKEGLIARIAERAHGPAGEPVPETGWPAWRPEADEFRRVRLTGTFLPGALVSVHGLAEERPGQALLGYYLFEPLRLANGPVVIVNRGFVPAEQRDRVVATLRAEPVSEVTVTGLVRAPESRGWFLPRNDAVRGEWFTRSPAEMARAAGLDRAAPFYVDQDRGSDPKAWPRGGQTPLTLRNPHLQYAGTWFGIAATLLGVFAAFAHGRLRRRDRAVDEPSPAST